MKKRSKNKFLLFVLIILVIIVAVVIFILMQKKEEDSNPVEPKIESIRYDNGDISYFDYYKEGQLDINISEYVKLPDDYLKYKSDSNNQEEIKSIIDKIIKNSEVKIPTKLLNGYYGDTYNGIKAGADLTQTSIDEYVKSVYGYENYQKYIEDNTIYIEENIKEDLIYQALAKDLNISINQADVEKFYSERIKNGDTYESLKENYGEKLMYKYTIQDKIEQELTKQLSK